MGKKIIFVITTFVLLQVLVSCGINNNIADKG